MSNVKLESMDGEIFEVDVEIAKKFGGVVKEMMELCVSDDQEVVPIERVNAAILKKVIEWVIHHRDDSPPPEDERKKKTPDISSWDKDFLNVDHGTLFGLIAAADYLNIELLQNIACKKVADMLKNKSADEIRKEFNIENDLEQDEV